MISFKIKGIKFTVSFLYIVLITFLSVYDKTGILLIGVLSALFHELCHLAAIAAVGGKPTLIGMEVSGIKIKQSAVLNNKSQIFVLFAGCIGNLILFTWGFIAGHLSLCTVNLCLLIFNLLPSRALDGGQILIVILNSLFSGKTAYTLFRFISISTSFAIVILGIYFIFKFKNPTLFLTGFFLVITSVAD